LDSREHKVTEAIKYKEVTTVTPQKHTKEEKKRKKKRKEKGKEGDHDHQKAFSYSLFCVCELYAIE